MVKQLSVVIAAYNVQDFIEKTLDSLVIEEILDELEVLIIDDGSKDNTTTIAKKYVDMHPNTFKLISKENGGHGSVLNCGIENATGRYYRPIDGDDWVDKQAMITLITKLRKINSDMVLTHYVEIYEKSEIEKKIKVKNVYSCRQLKRGDVDLKKYVGREVCVYGKEYDLNKDLYDFSDFYKFHYITYKTELLRKNNIKMTEKCFYDDMEYDLYPIKYVKTVTAIDCYLYQYRLERSGQSVEKESFIKNRAMRYKIVENTTKYFVENKNYFGNNVRNHLEYETIFRIIRQYEIYLMMDDLNLASNEMKQFDLMVMNLDASLYNKATNKHISYLRSKNFSENSITQVKKLIDKEKVKKHPIPWTIKSDKKMHIEIFKRELLRYTGLWIFSKEMKQLRKFKNIHKGERCFITCTGPSITMSDLEALSNETTFGVNSITMAYSHTEWRPTYYVLVDVFSFEKYLRETDIPDGYCKDTAFFHYRAKPKKLFGNELFIPVSYANHMGKWMEKNKIKLSGDISACVFDCFTVTIMAIQIAIYMGFKEIYIIGADCNYTTPQIHFIEAPGDKKKIYAGRLPISTERSINGYKAAKKYADKKGCSIVNVTRGGMLEVFPRKTLEEVLGEKMKVVLFIPIKLNNQRLPGKNIMPLCGKPLCEYLFETVDKIQCVNEKYVYCSDEAIVPYLKPSIKFLKRPKWLDGFEVKGLDIINEFVKTVDADIYVITHVTQPFVKKETFEKGIDSVVNGPYDSSFTAEELQDYFWVNNKPLNYDPSNIVRTQDLDPVYKETGAFFIFKKEIFEKMHRRIGTTPYIVTVDQFEAIDIDTKEDFEMAEAICSYIMEKRSL